MFESDNNCSFINNSAYNDNGDSFGGSIFCKESKGIFENCTILNNNIYSSNNNVHGGAFF